MVKIVGIQFKGFGRVYYFDPLDFELATGDYVVVETVRGLELGKVVIGNREVENAQIEYELKPIIKKALEKDIEQEEKNLELSKSSFDKFKKFVSQCKLEMKPLYCEYTLDQSKILFYYSADDRVDFRELLKLLTPEFRIRVELRQIGPREAARAIGGIGSCGREICCKSHLKNFDFVTMKMAKEQSMSLNTNKISGICGKLMCCIGYEAQLYQALKKELPGIGTMVKTPSCECCKVVGVDYMKKLVKTQENPSGMPAVHPSSEVEVLDFKARVEPVEMVTTIEMVDGEVAVTEEVIETLSDGSKTTETKKDRNNKKHYKHKRKTPTTNDKQEPRNHQ